MGKGVISLGKEKFVIESKEAQSEINFAEEVEHVNFYSRALGLLLWVRDGPSGLTRNSVVSASDGNRDGLGRGAAGPDRLCTTTAAGALRVIV